MNNKIIGNFGENVAEYFLILQGFKIIEKNYKCKQGEIDIIAKDKKEIVFIEVKTRKSLKCGTPAESINNEKIKHIYKVAKYYLYVNKLENEFVRFDAIEIFVKNNKCLINHIKQII